MKVTDHLRNSQTPTFSFELSPPQPGQSLNEKISILDRLSAFQPAWINVTSHPHARESDAAAATERPSLLEMCDLIQNRYEIDAVPHLLRSAVTSEQVAVTLSQFQALGVTNLFALRGDAILPPPAPSVFARDLVSDLRAQRALTPSFDFCVGVAGYPEKHEAAPDFATDIQHLKTKVDAGADYIITQLFYDTRSYFDFVHACRAAGITVPILPGLKTLHSASQLKQVPERFKIQIPAELSAAIISAPQDAPELGRRWTTNQIRTLLAAGVPHIHLFLTNDTDSTAEILRDAFA